MLRFVTRPEHVRFFEQIRLKMDEDLAARTSVLRYGELLDRPTLAWGSFVFTSLGLATKKQRELLATISRQLSEGGCRILNDPKRALGRLDLLKRMHDLGTNSFRAYSLEKVDPGSLHYPVFLRESGNHTGSLSALIESGRELEREANRLERVGFNRSGLLVVEFCDTCDEDGIFRKYSAMIVGHEAIPRYLDFSRDWVVKRSDMKLGGLLAGTRGSDRVAEEMRYIEENPHKDWIVQVAREAHIEFGRLDYGVKDGRPQLWEINTAPTFGTARSNVDSVHRDIATLRMPAKKLFYRRFLAALSRLAGAEAECTNHTSVVISVPEPLAKAVRTEIGMQARAAGIRRLAGAARRRLRQPGRAWLRALIRPILGPLNRAMRRSLARLQRL